MRLYLILANYFVLHVTPYTQLKNRLYFNSYFPKYMQMSVGLIGNYNPADFSYYMSIYLGIFIPAFFGGWSIIISHFAERRLKGIVSQFIFIFTWITRPKIFCIAKCWEIPKHRANYTASSQWFMLFYNWKWNNAWGKMYM